MWTGSHGAHKLFVVRSEALATFKKFKVLKLAVWGVDYATERKPWLRSRYLVTRKNCLWLLAWFKLCRANILYNDARWFHSTPADCSLSKVWLNPVGAFAYALGMHKASGTCSDGFASHGFLVWFCWPPCLMSNPSTLYWVCPWHTMPDWQVCL